MNSKPTFYTDHHFAYINLKEVDITNILHAHFMKEHGIDTMEVTVDWGKKTGRVYYQLPDLENKSLK